MSANDHYDVLFRDFVAAFGELDDDTLTSVIGFSAGGPVSLCRVRGQSVFVTCELSMYGEQLASSEGLKFELMYRGEDNADHAQALLSALGDLSFDAELGDGHSIDVSQVTYPGGPRRVRLALHSQCGHAGGRFGIYDVVRDDAGEAGVG